MTPPPRKKLIEVALPLKAINEASAEEKAVPRRGHPQAIHLWWARRPLAACRAVLFASLVDDPDYDPHFRLPDGTILESAARKRADLFGLIEELVQWENTNNEIILRSARAEIARCVASQLIESGTLANDASVGLGITAKDIVEQCHCRPQDMGLDKKLGRIRYHFDVSRLPPAEAVNAFLAKYAPPVLDPFCGGGSIPLEAQRLGLRTYASDLNPVPVLITKALIEIPPMFAAHPPVNPDWQAKSASGRGLRIWRGAQGLAEDVRYYGQWMRDEAQKRIGRYYPKVKITKQLAKNRPELEEYVGQELTVVAWLWARAVNSPNPLYQGVHVPLISTYWLNKKSGKLSWIEPIIDRAAKSFSFSVRVGEPTADEKKVIDVGTKLGRGCKFKCLLSDAPIPDTYVKEEGLAGRMSARLLAIVAEGRNARVYLPPLPEHEALLVNLTKPANLSGVEIPIAADKRAIWCLLYGLTSFDKLFSSRQLIALTTFSDLIQEAREQVRSAARINNAADNNSDDTAYADAVVTYLALAISKLADWSSTLCGFIPNYGKFGHTFGRQGIPMVWDFAELNVFSDAVGNWSNHVEWVVRAVEHAPAGVSANVSNLDATAINCGKDLPIISTDPPYYDNIGYADLSDYFYVWLRRSLSGIYPSLFATLLTPKSQELIASPYRHGNNKQKAQEFFEQGLRKAFARMQQCQKPEYPLTVYYAFKQSESDDEDSADSDIVSIPVSTGWETMLTGLIQAGLGIYGTWPIRTERGARSVGIGTNALASSIVLVCRPRSLDAALATRKEFMNTLRSELPDALRNLQQGNIAPVDLAQAAIGPGMAVFTRYSKVIETDGSTMTVRVALGIINQVLDEVLAEQEGEFDADTRWALAWFEQFGLQEGPFGVAETLSKAKNTAVNGLEEAGILRARGGKVQILTRNDLSENWDPTIDKRLTAWETTQYLIRTLEQQGEEAAATLLNKLGGMADTARDLAYRLFSICERKKWADEALAYNGLVIAWPELTKLAISQRSHVKQVQAEMF